MFNEEKLKKDWQNSEVAKRIETTELFAITHGFPQWTKMNLVDWWLAKVYEAQAKAETRGYCRGLDAKIDIESRYKK